MLNNLGGCRTGQGSTVVVSLVPFAARTMVAIKKANATTDKTAITTSAILSPWLVDCQRSLMVPEPNKEEYSLTLSSMCVFCPPALTVDPSSASSGKRQGEKNQMSFRAIPSQSIFLMFHSTTPKNSKTCRFLAVTIKSCFCLCAVQGK